MTDQFYDQLPNDNKINHFSKIRGQPSPSCSFVFPSTHLCSRVKATKLSPPLLSQRSYFQGWKPWRSQAGNRGPEVNAGLQCDPSTPAQWLSWGKVLFYIANYQKQQIVILPFETELTNFWLVTFWLGLQKCFVYFKTEIKFM